VVDVTEYVQVREAARGMDALINTSVVRRGLVAAFHVNLIGAYHVARAAVEHGITRIIHTGPQLVCADHGADYTPDFDVPDDVPARPWSGLYGISKCLAGELMRVFAERHGLEVIEFHYGNFVSAERVKGSGEKGLFPFTTAWEDTGGPFLHALRAPSSAFERPLERFHITSRLPTGKFGGSGKAQRLLGWSPEQDLAPLWTRDGSEGGDTCRQ
jgi:nucleoside-diphosphate-sugar epimerase